MNKTFSESNRSLISIKSQQLLETASRISKNSTKSYGKISENQSDELVSKCWDAFGLYISRQMRMGRGILIPHFGTFSFSAPIVHLDGVTNPIIRDKQKRQPVFLISKDFVNGGSLKAGVFFEGRLRPYMNHTSGVVQIVKINFAEISDYVQQSKDATRFAIERTLRVIADKCRIGMNVDLQIPGVGNFHVKNNIAAVDFNAQLAQQSSGVIKRPLSERRTNLNLSMTQTNLKSLNQSVNQNYIDNSGQSFLENLDINVDEIAPSQAGSKRIRPSSAGHRHTQSLHQKSVLQRSVGVPQFIKPDNAGEMQSFKNNVSDLEQGIKMLKFWIRQNRLNNEDAYLECCKQVFSWTSDRNVKMTLPQFTFACGKMELGLSQDQSAQLFNYLDKNQDGILNYSDWVQTINENSTHLNYIIDSVFKNKLHADDVLKTMRFHRTHPPITQSQLKQGLLHLDLSLDNNKAMWIALELLKGRDTITMSEIIKIFDCIEEEDKIFDASWFKDILFKIKEKLVNSQNYQSLRVIFEENDHANIGNLVTNEFKKCLMKSNLKLTITDINRIVRYLPKIRDNHIDYNQFLKQIDRVDVVSKSEENIGDIYEFAEKLDKYLQNKNIETFLKNVGQCKGNSRDQIGPDRRVTIEMVTDYLHMNVFQQTNKGDLQNYVKELDIDCDGYILHNDLQSFLQKHSYFQSVYTSKPEATRDLIRNKSYTNNHITLNTKGMFPTNPLPESKINAVLRDLRRNLEIQNISYPVLFSMIDTDKDGFITISELTQAIGKILPLSQVVIDGVFSFMDKLRIGVIDYAFFVKFLNKPVAQPEEELKMDSYDWQYNMIMRIRQWFQFARLTVEDAFKTFDKNFRGEVNEDELYSFLVDVIKVKESDINKTKLNRLFKLMDMFKKGRITFEDFRRFLCEDFARGENNCIMGHQVIDNFSSFDWKLNARQQIGLVLTRKFKDLSSSFNIISGYLKKLIFSAFRAWTKESNCLNGFDISENQLKELYADLDTHKKGYLLEQDWTTAFKGYDWKRQMLREIKEVLNRNFGSIKKAFDFFNKGRSIDQSVFRHGIEYLMPQRFIDSDLKDLWLISSSGQESIDYEQFQICFGGMKGLYKESYLNSGPHPIEVDGKSLKELEREMPSTLEAPYSTESLFERLRRYLRTTNSQIVQDFEKLDKDGSGVITNLQFVKILKQLNFDLKQEEIDVLLNLCKQEGKLHWRKFLNMIKLRESDHMIVDRAGILLQHFAQLIYTYMLSPKDAFRTYDDKHIGVLDFEQFQKMIQELTHLANEQMPSYIIVKDMFDYLDFTDQAKGGLITLNKWMNVFSKYDYVPPASIQKSKTFQQDPQDPSLIQPHPKPLAINQTSRLKQRPMSSHYQVKQVNFNSKMHQPVLHRENVLEQNEVIKQRKLGEWESSKEFDKIITAIGRNRKFLLNIFHQMQKRTVLSYQVVRQIIEQMLRNSGIQVPEEGWPILLKFAEKNKAIDYKFMLDVYKQRISKIEQHPIQILQN